MSTEQTTNQRASNRKGLYLVMGAVLLILVIVVMFISRQSFEKRVLHQTPLQSNDFGYLLGSDIYHYNGVVFEKINYDTGEKTVLAAGLKLPEPNAVFWSPGGVLINFDSSFWLTEVQSQLEKKGRELNRETRNYTWYLDFSSENLVLVDEFPINPSLAAYSESERGFYYTTVEVNQTTRQIVTSLNFFDAQTNESSSVVGELNLVDISYVGLCPGYKICLIARDSTDIVSERLLALNQSGQIEELLNSQGRLFSTNKPGLFVVVAGGDPVEDNAVIPEEVGYSDEPAELYSVETGASQPLGFDVGDSEIVFVLTDEQKYYAFDDQLEPSIASDHMYYRAGVLDNWFGQPSSNLLQIHYADGSLFSGGLTTNVSFGSNGDTLASSYANSHLLFSAKESIEGFTVLGQEEARNNIDECGRLVDVKAVDFFQTERVFKIYFTADNNFSRQVKDFATCLAGTNTLGHNYYFGGLDPINGRIVTD